MKRLTAVVHGSVQGVAFRANTQRAASRLHVTGWVANQWDGTVKVVAEGADESLRQLEKWLRQGPRAARVTKVEVSWSEGIEEYRGFQIRY